MISAVSPNSLLENAETYGKLIDVRSPAEFSVGHIPGAVNVPMEQVENRMADIGSGPVVLVCEAGTRARIVAGWLESTQAVSVLSGGTVAWRKAGLPIIKYAPCRWTLERQVRLAAGLIVLVGTLLVVLVNSNWVYLAMLVGAGLTFAGATNICGMAVVFAKMPWNRQGKVAAAAVTPAGAQCRS